MTSPDYDKIIKRSWELTWKNKWLWVYGLVLAALGGTSSFNFPSGGGSSGGRRSDLPKEGQKVLGEATNVVVSWLQSISPATWILLALGIAGIVIFVVAVNMVISAWAKGGLISGLETAENGKEVDLTGTSKRGLQLVKSLIVYSLISFGIALGLVLFFGLIGVVSALISNIILAIVGILGFFTLIIFLIILSMIGIYAERLIVLKKMTPWEAWKRGLSLSKGNFLHTAIMGIINSILGCAISCGGMIALLFIFAFLGAIVAIPMFVGGLHPVALSIAGLVILFFLAIYASLLIRAVVVVFSFGNWNLFFKEAIKNEVEEHL